MLVKRLMAKSKQNTHVYFRGKFPNQLFEFFSQQNVQRVLGQNSLIRLKINKRTCDSHIKHGVLCNKQWSFLAFIPKEMQFWCKILKTSVFSK